MIGGFLPSTVNHTDGTLTDDCLSQCAGSKLHNYIAIHPVPHDELAGAR